MKHKKLLMGLVVVILVAIAGALTPFLYKISNRATITTSLGINIYSNVELTDLVTFIDWGYVEPGETISRTIWIDNNGSMSLLLDILTNNWDPSNCTDYISCYWGVINGTILSPSDAPIETALYLKISSEVEDIKTFTFNIFIGGTEVL